MAGKTTTEQILERFKGIEDRLAPVDGLLKMMEGPASKAGLTPTELISKMTDGGRRSGFLGNDGSMIDANDYASSWGAYKTMGPKAAEWLESLYYYKRDGAQNASRHYKRLQEMGVQSVRKDGEGHILKAALAEGSGTTGGYTVPPEFQRNLLSIAAENAVVEPLCSKFPMSAMTLQVPSLDVTTAQSAGTTPFFGGVLAKWAAESATLTESEPKFRQTELSAKQLSLYMIAGNNLIADSAIGLEALLTMLMSGAITWYREYAYLQGNNVGQPMGILNAGAAISVNRNTGSKVIFIDLANMYSKVWFADTKSPSLRFHAHQSTIPQFLYLNDNTAASQTGRLTFQSIDQGAVKAPTWQVFGVPLHFTEKLPALGTKGDVVLVDWQRYLLGQRMELQIDVSPHVNFLQNQMVWRVIWRGDGQPWLNSAITLADGSQTVSPFVILN